MWKRTPPNAVLLTIAFKITGTGNLILLCPEGVLALDKIGLCVWTVIV